MKTRQCRSAPSTESLNSGAATLRYFNVCHSGEARVPPAASQLSLTFLFEPKKKSHCLHCWLHTSLFFLNVSQFTYKTSICTLRIQGWNTAVAPQRRTEKKGTADQSVAQFTVVLDVSRLFSQTRRADDTRHWATVTDSLTAEQMGSPGYLAPCSSNFSFTRMLANSHTLTNYWHCTFVELCDKIFVR